MRHFLFLCGLSLFVTPVFSGVTYVSAEKFVSQSFSGQAPKPKILWLTKKTKPTIKTILGHKYPALRLRYWGKEHRSVWILEETGKEKPITTGIVINNDKIEKIKILIYRESRGNEVRHDYFTDQFIGNRLLSDYELSDDIDGISGATLSVSAIKRLTRLALYFHSRTRFSGKE